MQPRVIGLDLSLTATGLALYDGARATITTGPGQHIEDQHDRIAYIADEVTERTWAGTSSGPVLAVLEGPSYGSTGAHTWDRAGLWWLTYHHLHGFAVPVAVVPPSTLKRYATGKGAATKADMRMALFQRTGLDVRDDNQVDAWWLRAMGLDHLGCPVVEVPKTHRAALEKVEWPEVRCGD